MKKISFNISARTAKLIGQENFANAEGAVIELVKNSYDADATLCIVVFRQTDSSLYIIDDGDGMTEEIISKYWMTIGTDNKNNNSKTSKQRVRTGAKGIGRFALDRLGAECEMITSTVKTTSIEWKVSWSQFDGPGINLSDVNASLEELPQLDIRKEVEEVLSFAEMPEDFFKKHFIDSENKKPVSAGTIIKIKSLRDNWDEKALSQLSQNLELLIPPLEQDTFSIYLFAESFEHISGKIIPAPFDDYDYKLTAKVLENRKVTINIQRKELLLSSLKARNFFLESNLTLDRYSLDAFEKGEFEIDTTLEGLMAGFKESGKIENINKIGPFEFTFLFLKRGGSSEKDEDERVFPYRSIDYSERVRLLNTYGGIKIFRDNFRVRPYGEPKSSSFDWLELGSRVVQNPTVTRPGYRVRPNQVYGIINISKIDNPLFIDKSNREGFQENDTFALFKSIIISIINVFENDRNQIMIAVKKIFDNHNKKERAKSTAGEEITKFKKKANEGKKTTPEEKEKLLDEAKSVINTSEEAIKALKEDIDELLNEQKILRVLASTGLTVSSFAHELKGLSGILIPRSGKIKSVLEEYIKPEDLDKVKPHRNPYIMLDDIKSDDQRISQWLDFALFSLRKDKRKRVKLNLVDYIDKLQKTWSALLELKRIKLIVKKSNFVSVFFTGYEIDLDSIFNNLIANSVEAFVRPDASSKREITLSFSFAQNASGISIVYEDSGPGLSPDISDLNQIFQPFFSTKRDPNTGELIGTGLGMWLVKSTIDEYKGSTRISDIRPGFKLSINLPA